MLYIFRSAGSRSLRALLLLPAWLYYDLYTVATDFQMCACGVGTLSPTRKTPGVCVCVWEWVLRPRSPMHSTHPDNKFVSLSSNRINLFFTHIWQSGSEYAVVEEIEATTTDRPTTTTPSHTTICPFAHFSDCNYFYTISSRCSALLSLGAWHIGVGGAVKLPSPSVANQRRAASGALAFQKIQLCIVHDEDEHILR